MINTTMVPKITFSIMLSEVTVATMKAPVHTAVTVQTMTPVHTFATEYSNKDLNVIQQ
jgi:hypothetical protein